MFGGGSSSSVPKSESTSSPEQRAEKGKAGSKSASPEKDTPASASPTPAKTTDQAASGEKRSGNGSPPNPSSLAEQKKRRSSGVGARTNSELGADSKSSSQTPLQKLGKQDQALAVPQGQHNNAAGESLPGPKSTFKVGVWEDRNKKCRRTMEDTHAFLYNFLNTPAPALGADNQKQQSKAVDSAGAVQDMLETDNGYFAIFDGHAGTFAADWCGKKLHIILEDVIRENPNAPIPELLDRAFTTADAQLEELPLKNSGCTAAVAVLRWEDRVPSMQSATGSQPLAPAVVRAAEEASKTGDAKPSEAVPPPTNQETLHARLKSSASRARVLYTANVGDARIILCRAGKALRLSYDHKGSDEIEGKRIANAGGLILSNRVNGVLAVTRALGDTYMKDLITGHPYTTETVVQPDVDEFLIIACDGLWDVCKDQEAVDLVRNIQEPVSAAKLLVDHALERFSTDNLSCMIVRFDKQALLDHQTVKEKLIGVEGDDASAAAAAKVSESEKILIATRQKIAEGGAPAVGISASNSGRGHDSMPVPAVVEAQEQGGDAGFTPTMIDGPVVEEEPSSIDEDDEDNNDSPV